MGRAIFYKCSSCDEYYIMQWSSGWLDENGNFGYGMDPEFEVIGNPEGEWDMINFHDRICLECGKKYVIIQGNLKKFPVKHEQLIQSSPDSGKDQEKFALDSEISCLNCKNDMLNGEDLIPHVLKREKYSRMKLEPLERESMAVICLKCKKGYLTYDGSGVS